jgi:predicted transcriptional regulator
MTRRTASIRVDDEKLDRLDKLAEAVDRPRSWLINQAIDRYLDEEEQFIAAVEEGIAAADRGELIPHEQVMKEARDLVDRAMRRKLGR